MTKLSKMENGFSLVELMTVVIILAIMATIGLPALATYLERSRVESAAGELLSGLQLARNEAVRLNNDVRVCASDDDASCSGTWADGWLVAREGGELVRVMSQLPSSVTLNGPDDNEVVFNSAGTLVGAAKNFRVESGATARCITILLSGRSELGACE
jgi:type IV fimbrial biogenesis protein FimT